MIYFKFVIYIVQRYRDRKHFNNLRRIYGYLSSCVLVNALINNITTTQWTHHGKVNAIKPVQNDTDLLFVNMFLFITSRTAMKAINYFREKNISWYQLIDNYNATPLLSSPVYLIYKILLLSIWKHLIRLIYGSYGYY